MAMTTHFALRRSAFLVLSMFFLSQMIAAQQVTSTSSHASTMDEYPDNSEGLRQLLDNMLLAAKKGDGTRLQSMIRETEIPNYESWFTTTFARESGESWAEAYGRWLAKNEKEFQELMMRLANMDGEFVVEKAGAMRKSDLLNNPLDGYRADWRTQRTPKAEEVVHIADFFFIEGKFRWDSTVEYFPFQKTNTGSIVPAKLVKKVQPEYPAEAQKKGIEGTVKLQVIVRKDGTVTVQNVIEGDPVLSPAAIKAVQQWRYEPWQLNGQPVEMQTIIDVTFALKR
jgi:TonB family protein